MIVLEYQVVVIPFKLYSAPQITTLKPWFKNKRWVLRGITNVERPQILVIPVNFALVLKLLCLLIFLLLRLLIQRLAWTFLPSLSAWMHLTILGASLAIVCALLLLDGSEVDEFVLINVSMLATRVIKWRRIHAVIHNFWINIGLGAATLLLLRLQLAD